MDNRVCFENINPKIVFSGQIRPEIREIFNRAKEQELRKAMGGQQVDIR